MTLSKAKNKNLDTLASALYLHFPFCKAKCFYCDFAVRVLHQDTQIDRYLDHLVPEISFLSAYSAPLKTIYCGGGTPTLLKPKQVERVCKAMQHSYSFATPTEWTLEANPDQINTAESIESLNKWKAAGVNRLSLGVQSFDNRLLKLCGRTHQAEDIGPALSVLRQLGFNNISLDLIYALPEQSLQSWKETLIQTLALKPEHISLYALEIHPETVFGHQSLNLPEEDLAVDMYDLACKLLAEAGFVHYEIANWCQPGLASQHNQVYWRNQPFLAAGVGAHGYLQRRRYANSRDMRTYYQDITTANWRWKIAPEQSRKEEIEERIFLGLRLLNDGLNLREFELDFGLSLESLYPERLPFLLQQNLLEIQQGRLRLSSGAVTVSNAVFAEFLEPCLPRDNL